MPSAGQRYVGLQFWINASMSKATLSSLRRISLNALGFLSICVGVWLGGVAPVEILATGHRAANTAAHYAPNMEPGVASVLALILTIPILVMVLLVEFTRWALSRKSLGLPASVALGILAAWPVGYSFAIATQPLGYALVLLISSLGVVAFYSARWACLASRGCRARITRQ
jgi:hypothetical protein